MKSILQAEEKKRKKKSDYTTKKKRERGNKYLFARVWVPADRRE